MLFNSYEFIFIYLPIVFFGFFFIAKYSVHIAAFWLGVTSLFFYGYWNPKFVSLLLVSILFNYGAGYLISYVKHEKNKKLALIFSVTANLTLLGIFKYANFFIDSINTLGAQWHSLDIILPLGISFFTFTQIAYLVDVYRGVAQEYNLIHYILFVTWFPHLIAGPVLHHKQMIPQFTCPTIYKPNSGSIAIGLTLFSLGLFKKVVLADQFALFADPLFAQAAQGLHPTFIEAWFAALSYTLQLYFDFSGYSDMAIGLSRMFNIKLPINFDSPYKAANIIDFWRRWHMTLSKFLRDYLYIPLGGSRKGGVKRHFNILVTMLLGGLWHGSGWNFVLWGGLHGLYLIINHSWRKLTGATGKARNWLTNAASIFLTFAVVVFAWVPFRATSIKATINFWDGMIGLNGISLPASFAGIFGDHFTNFIVFSGINIGDNISMRSSVIWLMLGMFIIWIMPNTQQFLRNFSPVLDLEIRKSRLAWRPTNTQTIVAGLGIGTLFVVTCMCFNKFSTFIYFQF